MPRRTGGRSDIKAAGARMKYDLRHLGHRGGKAEALDTGAGKRCHVSGAIRHGCRRPVGRGVPIVAGRIQAPGGAVGVDGVQRTEPRR